VIQTTLIVLCAGESSRFKSTAKKQWLRIEDQPLWLNVTNRLAKYANFSKIIVVGHNQELNYMRIFNSDYEYVAGGSTRQESIKNGLQNVTTKYVMITDVARCCVPKKIIKRLIKNRQKANCIVPMIKVSDTVVFKDDTINRDKVKLIQTPQLSQTKILKYCLKNDAVFTDDSSAIKNNGGTIYYIKGSKRSEKLTFGNELKNTKCLTKPSKDQFIGYGIDIHKFEQNKQMYLGGIKIKSPFGFKAHSDGDVLIHSIIDAILGAAGAGDIGEFFPDTDPKYKDIDSKELLRYIVKFINNVGYSIVNIDLTILAQIPKITPYKKQIKKSLSNLLCIDEVKINIKATTAEKMGFVGNKEGVTVYTVANLKYYDWTK
jgi:2-C-methyl-D-erythritol 4-phosphate cytidylyltransferase/2-C-methyl-D-erythritol 2,4-cyclodiphosphate synthase